MLFRSLFAFVLLAGMSAFAKVSTKASTKMRLPQSDISLPATASEVSTSKEAMEPAVVKIQSENQAFTNQNFVPAIGAPIVQIKPNFGSENSDLNLNGLRFGTAKKGLVTDLRWVGRVGKKMIFEVQNDFGSQDVDVDLRLANSPTIKQSYRSAGLGDFHVVARSFNQRENGILHFGANFGLNNGPLEWGNNSQDANRSSGGTTLTPFLSYETRDLALSYGWKTSITVKNDRSIESLSLGSAPTRFQETGGNIVSLAAFSEKSLGKAILGGLAQINMVGASEWEFVGSGHVNIDPSQTLLLTGYFENRVSDKMALIPSLSLKTLLGSNGNVDQQSAVDLGVAARISL